jgi:hemin uptake protein HemP
MSTNHPYTLRLRDRMKPSGETQSTTSASQALIDRSPKIVSTTQLPRLNTGSLFGSGREVLIDHNGREYRLRITAQHKLILTA